MFRNDMSILWFISALAVHAPTFKSTQNEAFKIHFSLFIRVSLYLFRAILVLSMVNRTLLTFTYLIPKLYVDVRDVLYSCVAFLPLN
jgi:hypothetical protein